MLKDYSSKAIASLFVLTTLTACGGGGGSDESKVPDSSSDGGGVTQPTNVAPTTDAGADQTVEENSAVSLSGTATDSDGSIASYSWTQTSGTSVSLTNADTATASFTAPEVSSDETLSFVLTTTDDKGDTSEDSVDVKVNHFFDKNIILRVVRVTEDWMPYASTDGWTNAVEGGLKESDSVKYLEVAIWEETDSVHLYAFDNEFDPLYGLVTPDITDEQKIAYRESYRLLKFDGLPSESSSFARSEFLRKSFIEIADYIVAQYPNTDQHLMFSGHGGPGGNLFEGHLLVDDVSLFLESWTLSLGHNLGVIDMGGPCNKGSLADLKSFCEYADYYVASDLPNGGYTFDDWTKEKFDETEPTTQYHQLFANSTDLKDVLFSRIDLKRKAYEYSKVNMTENKVEQGNYLYSCSAYADFNDAFSEFVSGKSNYSIGDDLLKYLENSDAPASLIGKFNNMILRSADNKDFFDWEVESNGLLME